MVRTFFMAKKTLEGIETLELNRSNVLESLKDAVAEYSDSNERYDIVTEDLVKITFDDEKVDQDLLKEDKVSISETTVTDIMAADIEEDVKSKISEYATGRTVLRALAASLGYGLDSIVASMDSESPFVVVQAAKKKYKLEILKSCKATAVRAEVARYAFADELIKENDVLINCAIAESSSDFELLSELLRFDQYQSVKIALIERGIGKEMFVNDTDKQVLIALAESTADAEILAILLHDDYDKVKSAVLRNEYITEDNCMEALAVNENGEFINNRYIRIEIAKQAIKHNWTSILEILAKDGAVEVRMELAKAGACRDILLKDTSSAVRHEAYLAGIETAE